MVTRKKAVSDWSSLEDDAARAARTRHSCSVNRMLGFILTDHGAAAHEAVIRTLANHRLTSPSIRKALENRVDSGLLPSVATLQRHRTGSCSCKREAS